MPSVQSLAFALMRRITRVLKLLGLRERVLHTRIARARRRRRAAEAQGSDRLSRPALHDLETALAGVFGDGRGFFVEAGGNDGYTQSNTYWLERFRGWRGILVEPMAELHALCVAERPDAQVFRAALVERGYDEPTVTMQFGDLMSVMADTDSADWTAPGLSLGWRDAHREDVPARTLSSILDEAGAPEIDLLSLDVEGHEPQVLRGLDLGRHAPRWLLIEAHDLVEGRARLEAELGGRYVLDRVATPVDLLYRRSDLPPSTAPVAVVPTQATGTA